MTDQTPVSGKDTFGVMKANTLAVNIAFHLSAQSKHGKSVISLPINIPGYNYFSVTTSSYDGESPVDSLQARHDTGLISKYMQVQLKKMVQSIILVNLLTAQSFITQNKLFMNILSSAVISMT